MVKPDLARSSRRGVLVLEIVVLTISVVCPASGQPPPGVSNAPNLATQQKQLEEAFQKALNIPQDEPLQTLQAWGVVMMNAVMVERVRSITGLKPGSPPRPANAQAAMERVLERWHRERPESGGPELLRVLRLQHDPATKRAALLQLLDRYPDDPLVVWQAANELRQAGETQQATAVVEDFAERNPKRSVAYHLLAQDAGSNVTRRSEILQRWARALPGDSGLVGFAIGSELARQDPAATERILQDFFETSPGKADDFQACRQVAEKGPAEFRPEAQACIARIAADPRTPSELAKQATTAMLAAAAAEGNWNGLLSALDDLEPAARAQALVVAADRIPAPQRCADRVAILSELLNLLGSDDDLYSPAAASLGPCSARPEARSLYVTLIQQAPPARLPEVVRRWETSRGNQAGSGLPAGGIAALEQRLRNEPRAAGIYGALDLAYKTSGDEEKRFQLLRRWQRDAPRSFTGAQAVGLAQAFERRAQPDEAIAVLEGQVRSGGGVVPNAVNELWRLYGETGSPARADSFADELLSSGSSYLEGLGHHLAARSDLTRRDFAGAESHYWKALESHVNSSAVATELLAAIATSGDTRGLESTAEKICRQTELARNSKDVPACAASLLARAGQTRAASHSLQAQAAGLPDDLESLRTLAATARTAGQMEVAERALRRILEIDPKDENNWVQLGLVLESRGRTDELVDLLDRSRQQFPTPPVSLARAAGRALASTNQPERGIRILVEARNDLPAGDSGKWNRREIDAELRQAYAALGKQRRAAVVSNSTPKPAKSVPTTKPLNLPDSPSVAELRTEAEALGSGENGRYDPDAGRELWARAAAAGDPIAMFQLAVMNRLQPEEARPGEASPEALYDRSAEQVLALAKNGNSRAGFLVGTAALIGLGQPEDLSTARHWLEVAAKGGESWAWHNLAWMEATGRGLEEPDPVAAQDDYRKAAELGNARSMFDLARLLLTQKDPTADACAEALNWLRRSARTGNAQAAFLLGKMLFYGQSDCVTPDPQTALPWLEVAASTHQDGGDYVLGLALVLHGADDAARSRGLEHLQASANRPNPLAVDTLAFLYATGIGVDRNPQKARHYLDEGPRLGSDSMARLGEQLGRSEPLDDVVARGLTRLAAFAGRGDAFSAALLARLGEIGFGDDVSSDRMLALARLGAAEGEALAMRVLSDAYLQGIGIQKNDAEGESWRQRCAQAGDSFCMMFYATDLMEGDRVNQDVQAGLTWLRRAGEAGNWWAITDLGNLYDEGWHGIPRDEKEAASWKRRLANLGDAEAAGWLLYHGYR